jgi:hypothetical protein
MHARPFENSEEWLVTLRKQGKANFKSLAYFSLIRMYRMGHEKVSRLPFARVLVIFSLALVYCVE